MNRKLILFLISAIVFLCSSCSKESSTLALVSSSGGEISIVDSSNSFFLVANSAIIDKLCSLSGLDAQNVVASLFDDVDIYEVAPQRFLARDRYVSLLMSQDDDNRVSVLSKNNKVLSGSELILEMDEYSGGFDSALLKQVDNVDKTYQYELSSILYDAMSWEDALVFFSEWKNAIIR